jgi:hypothetical protein
MRKNLERYGQWNGYVTKDYGLSIGYKRRSVHFQNGDSLSVESRPDDGGLWRVRYVDKAPRLSRFAGLCFKSGDEALRFAFRFFCTAA